MEWRHWWTGKGYRWHLPEVCKAFVLLTVSPNWTEIDLVGEEGIGGTAASRRCWMMAQCPNEYWWQMVPLRSLDWDWCYSINAIQLSNDIDKGIEDIPNSFANNATLNGAAGTEGQCAIQRDLDKPKKGTHGNLIKFSQVQGPAKGLGQAPVSTQAGGCTDQKQPSQEGRSWWRRGCTWPGNVSLQPRKPVVFWAAAKAVWPAGEGRGFSLSR